MRSPILAGVAASAGTFVVMGGATLAVSVVSLTVARRVIRYRKVVANLRTCSRCEALSGKVAVVLYGT